MSSPTPTAPAGWYPDATDATIQRYWDGTAWTSHTAPLNAQPVTGTAPATGGIKNKKLIVIGSVVAGVLLLGGIASANSAMQVRPQDEAAPALIAVTPTAEPVEPVEEVVEAEPVATPEPTIEATTEPEIVADPAVFKADALRDLKDFKKDLDDMDKTLDEDGFWRLLSNSAELGFNLGQLQTHEAPDAIASKWDAGLVTLDAKIDAITDEIGNDDTKATRKAISNARKQANNLIALVKKID